MGPDPHTHHHDRSGDPMNRPVEDSPRACPSCASDTPTRRLTPYLHPTTSCFDPWHDAANREDTRP